MKLFLPLLLFLCSALFCQAQKTINTLPSGKYETVIKNSPDKWERGDIIILDENRYKISTTDNIGEYKFSASAQRIFFTSGPLKSAFAKISYNNTIPVIVLPVVENEQVGLKLPSEIWGYYKQ
jgi:hypothetical protein